MLHALPEGTSFCVLDPNLMHYVAPRNQKRTAVSRGPQMTIELQICVVTFGDPTTVCGHATNG